MADTPLRGSATDDALRAAAGPVREPPLSNGTPVAGLLRSLFEDLAELLSKELRLARSEIGESVNRAKTGAGALAGGGAVAFAGLLFLLQAVMFALAERMPAWGAALAVGAVTLVIGLIMLQSGRKRFAAEAFVPERTLDALHKDQAMVKGKLS